MVMLANAMVLISLQYTDVSKWHIGHVYNVKSQFKTGWGRNSDCQMQCKCSINVAIVF